MERKRIQVIPEVSVSDVFVSAVQLAKLAGVKPSDIHYWGRFGYLARRKSRGAPYPLDQLPKAQLMGLFAKRLDMRAEKAAQFADQILPLLTDQIVDFQAIRSLFVALDSHIAELIALLVNEGVLSKIQLLLEEKR